MTAVANKLAEAVELLLERIDHPPAANCSCHLTPPCGDCVDYGGLREAIEEANAALAAHEQAKAASCGTCSDEIKPDALTGTICSCAKVSPAGRDERARFEAWWAWCIESTKKYAAGDDVFLPVRLAWAAWQAALAARQPVGAEENVAADTYWTVAGMIEPHIQDGALPASVHDSVAILLDHWLKTRHPVGQEPAMYQVRPRSFDDGEGWRKVTKREYEDRGPFPGYDEAEWERRTLYAAPAQAVDQQYVDVALHYGAHANRMRLVLKSARACIEAWSHPAIIEHSRQRILQQIDEVLDAYAKREALPEVATDQPWQLQLADALDCAWNPAIQAERDGGGPAAVLAHGLAAVATRLREHAAGEVTP